MATIYSSPYDYYLRHQKLVEQKIQRLVAAGIPVKEIIIIEELLGNEDGEVRINTTIKRREI